MACTLDALREQALVQRVDFEQVQSALDAELYDTDGPLITAILDVGAREPARDALLDDGADAGRDSAASGVRAAALGNVAQGTRRIADRSCYSTAVASVAPSTATSARQPRLPTCF